MERPTTASELRRLMRNFGLNPKRLAREAGVNETYVRDILKGRSQNPKTEQLRKVATRLGTTVDALLTPPPNVPTRSDRLRWFLEHVGWGPDFVAGKINVQHEVMLRYLSGAEQPTDEIVLRLGRALKVSVDYLLDGTLGGVEPPQLRELLAAEAAEYSGDAAGNPPAADTSVHSGNTGGEAQPSPDGAKSGSTSHSS